MDSLLLEMDMILHMIQIGSLYYFSSISLLSKWKKLEETTYKVILVAGPSLENWGLEPSRTVLRNQLIFFGFKTFLVYIGPCHSIIHTYTFLSVKKLHQSNLVCKTYASYKLTYHVDHHGTRGFHVIPCYSLIWG
jgi:hypothetical protein